jgi:hypothetical protein
LGSYGGVRMLNTIPDGCEFSTEFSTWIIAYCPDTNSWFCTNERFFYYEYDKEFENEKAAIYYFENNIEEFVNLTQQMYPKKQNSVFLENTEKTYTLYRPGWWREE